MRHRRVKSRRQITNRLTREEDANVKARKYAKRSKKFAPDFRAFIEELCPGLRTYRSPADVK